MSAARPVYGNVVVADDDRAGALRAILRLLPLLSVVIGLVVATVWYVALPAFDRQPTADRSCEVVILKSGSTACVRDPSRLRARSDVG